jgi:hypothetical protein
LILKAMKHRATECGDWREAIRLQAGGALATEQTVALERHLAGCSACREYADGLRGITSGLRWLASQPVEPGPNLRRRWTAAVVERAQPAGFGEWAGLILDWCRWRLRRNRGPLLALAPVWVLIFLLKISAPEVSPTASATVAHSPVEIFRALKAQAQLLAGQNDRRALLPGTPQKAGPNPPRSEGSSKPSPAREAKGPDQVLLELAQHETTLGPRV